MWLRQVSDSCPDVLQHFDGLQLRQVHFCQLMETTPNDLAPPWTGDFISPTNMQFSVFIQSLNKTFHVDNTSHHCKMTLGQVLVMYTPCIRCFVFLGCLLHSWFHRTWSPVYRLITLAHVMLQPALWETHASACSAALSLSRLNEWVLPGTDIKWPPHLGSTNSLVHRPESSLGSHSMWFTMSDKLIASVLISAQYV